MLNNALVILSGGQDSTTALFWAKERFKNIYALTFKYGQRHKVEIEAAKKIVKLTDIKNHIIISLDGYKDILKYSKNPLTNLKDDIPQYNKLKKTTNIEKTFVPGRNIYFLTLASSLAYNLFDDDVLNIVIGVSQEDYGGYPDCRREFIESMQNSLSLGLAKQVNIHTPLINLTKKETVLLCLKLKGCYEAMAYTHTCYNGEVPPCMKCNACLLRQKGFKEAEVIDPLLKRFNLV